MPSCRDRTAEEVGHVAVPSRTDSPSKEPVVGVQGHLPVLLQRAVERVKGLDNAHEVVSALVPDMGCAREGMRITRGGVQRALHGLGEGVQRPRLSAR